MDKASQSHKKADPCRAKDIHSACRYLAINEVSNSKKTKKTTTPGMEKKLNSEMNLMRAAATTGSFSFDVL